MLPKQEVVAMLLAGGQGSRLGVLTKKLAKETNQQTGIQMGAEIHWAILGILGKLKGNVL